MSEDWDAMIRGLRTGDSAVLTAFFARYAPALERIAARHLNPGMRRRVGPESIALSVCRTFMRRAAEDAFELERSDGLWALLCAITLTKVREKTRYHMRHKRAVQAELHADALEDGAFQPAAGGPSPDEIAAFTDQFDHVLKSLDEEERTIVQLRLDERTNEEIAETIGCSERTVRRVLKRLEARLIDDLS
jgi:RNA polymerase sigma factor (sigma-70 family)